MENSESYITFEDSIKKLKNTFIFMIAKMLYVLNSCIVNRGGSRAAATSKMECFVIIVNGF